MRKTEKLKVLFRGQTVGSLSLTPDKRIYVQVTYLLASNDTIKRVFGTLAAINDNYPKYVVSLYPVSGGFSEYPGIEHVNLREFLKTNL